MVFGLGVGLLFSACGGGEGDGAEANGAEADAQDAKAVGTRVRIVNFLYEPAELQVAPGTKVTWTNEDADVHNVQDLSDLKKPRSPEMIKGASYSTTFDTPGEYKYDCSLHPVMVGTIKVQ